MWPWFSVFFAISSIYFRYSPKLRTTYKIELTRKSRFPFWRYVFTSTNKVTYNFWVSGHSVFCKRWSSVGGSERNNSIQYCCPYPELVNLSAVWRTSFASELCTEFNILHTWKATWLKVIFTVLSGSITEIFFFSCLSCCICSCKGRNVIALNSSSMESAKRWHLLPSTIQKETTPVSR